MPQSFACTWRMGRGSEARVAVAPTTSDSYFDVLKRGTQERVDPEELPELLPLLSASGV